MADLKELEAAFVKADAAGNAEDAQAFATEIKRLRAAPQEQGVLKTLSPFVRNVAGGPLGVLGNAVVQKVGQTLDRAAYDAGGKVTDMAAGSMSPEAAAGLGLAANVAVQSVPMLVGGAAGKAAAPAFERGARTVMQSALKPSRAAIDSGKADQAITTLLDRGINASEGGASVLRAKIDVLGNEVKDILQRYPFESIDKAKVTEAFAGAFDKAIKQGTPQSDLAIINKAMQEFLSHPLFATSSKIPVQLAQEIKQGVWRKLGDKSFGKGLVPDAERDAQKAIGSGLRKEIESAVPAVAPINAEQGELLNALKQVQRRAGIEGNKNIVGLGALSPSIEHALIWALDRSPAGKSLLARAMHSGSEQIPSTIGKGVGAFAGPYLGREPRSLQELLERQQK